MKTSRLPGALSLLTRSWLHSSRAITPNTPWGSPARTRLALGRLAIDPYATMRERHGRPRPPATRTTTSLNERFPAGQSEITTDALVNGLVFPSDQVVNSLYPYKFTAQVYGDGQRYGLHRIWKAGIPNTATIVLYAVSVSPRASSNSRQASSPASEVIVARRQDQGHCFAGELSRFRPGWPDY